MGKRKDPIQEVNRKGSWGGLESLKQIKREDPSRKKKGGGEEEKRTRVRVLKGINLAQGDRK